MVTYEDARQLSDDELFAMLGTEILGEGLGAGPAAARRLASAGRDWYYQNIANLRQVVCSDDNLSRIGTDEERVLVAIGAAIGSRFDLSAAGYVPLSLIILRVELDKFCQGLM